MAWHNSPSTYGLFTKLLHWLIAIHMIGLIALGWWMIDLGFYSSWYYLAPFLHKAFGVLVFVLGVALLIWHRISQRPGPLEGHKPIEKLASHIAHKVLIIGVITIPISGYIFTTSKGEGVDMFGLFTIPGFFPVSDLLRDIAIDFHIYASYGLIAVIGAHGLGALKHHFVDKDQTLRRMTL